ncbi:MAG: hypothetical protein IPF68_16415 [Bacteroidales bacterium]|nr:hypothetical protein [Bacteroidales bacterium]
MVILIHVPSLNERKEDIPLLANYFITDIRGTSAAKSMMIFQRFHRPPFRNNLDRKHQEPSNAVERLTFLCDGTIIR